MTVGGGVQKKSNHLDEIYPSVVASFQKQGWTMLDFSAVTGNAAYVQTYKDTMDGWQNKVPPNKDTYRFVSSRVFDYDGLRILGVKGREKLMNDLKVDAIIGVSIDSRLESQQLVGALVFQVYGRGSDNAIWFDNNVQGDPVAPSSDELNLINPDALNKSAVRFAKGAAAKIAKPQ